MQHTKKLCILSLLNLFVLIGFSQTDQNITNHLFSDTEPTLAVNPANPNNVIAAWMHVTSFTQVTIFTKASTDGGSTWNAFDTLPHVSQNFTSADVSVCFNSAGVALLSYVDYKLTTDSGFVRFVKSTDGGLTWSNPVNAVKINDAPDMPVDRPWIAVDNSGGTNNGKIYIVSKSYFAAALPQHIWLTSSTDNGNSWSPILLLDAAIPIDLLTNIMAVHTVGADGSLYIIYASYSPSLNLNARIICLKSTDGGMNFTPHIVGNIPAGSNISDTLYQGSYSVSANPTNANNIVYQVTSNINGDPDIFSSYSNDGGNSWSSLIRVNDDPVSNGKGQDMSWSGFSSGGTFAVAWRDRRNFVNGSSSDFEIFTALSTDGGISYHPNFRLSSASSPVIPMSKGNDFLGVCINSNYIFSDWSDKRTSNHEIFFRKELVSTVLKTQQLFGTGFFATLYPNPAEDKLFLEFSKAIKGEIRLNDLNGKTVFRKNISSEKEQISLDKMRGGMYLIQVETGSETISRRFVVSK